MVSNVRDEMLYLSPVYKKYKLLISKGPKAEMATDFVWNVVHNSISNIVQIHNIAINFTNEHFITLTLLNLCISN